MIPVARPSVGEIEAAAARRVVTSGWLTQGPEVAAFEREFAAHVGAPHACAVSNCTTALHLVLLALGIGRGDEVITVSHSFIATANAIRHAGARPVFVDVDPATYNIDADKARRAIGPRTRAILCVHQMGLPCDLGRLVPLAQSAGIPLIEDAACAAGSEIRWQGEWQRIGRPHGDVACFSFHPRKVITTGEGGMVTTADAGLDRQIRLLRQHAMTVPDIVRHGSAEVVFESYPETGYNFRMTDIQGAIGRAQLQRLDELVARRRARAERYRRLLQPVPGVRAPSEPPYAHSNWQSYCVRLPDGVDQRDVMQLMLDRGIATRRGIMCSHLEPAFAGEPLEHELTHSERARRRSVLLPLYPELSDAEQDKVVDGLMEACARAVRHRTKQDALAI